MELHNYARSCCTTSYSALHDCTLATAQLLYNSYTIHCCTPVLNWCTIAWDQLHNYIYKHAQVQVNSANSAPCNSETDHISYNVNYTSSSNITNAISNTNSEVDNCTIFDYGFLNMIICILISII